VVVVRFDSSEQGAVVQAEHVIHDIGGRILGVDEETALASAFAGSPWTGAGMIGAVATLPARAGVFLSSLSATCDAITWHPLLGTGEVCFATETLGMVRAAVRTAGGHLVIRRGDATSGGEVDDEVALELMRSVKRQLDPARTLSPGRQAGGI
jgi:hypothetical protein